MAHRSRRLALLSSCFLFASPLPMAGCGASAASTSADPTTPPGVAHHGGHHHGDHHHGDHHHGDHHHGDAMHHRFEDAAAWAREFDAPERDAWQMPDRVVEALALEPSAIVADLGAGTGYFAVRLARAVPEGRVIGLDIEASMVDYLTRRAAEEGLTNLRARPSTLEDAGLDEPVDLVLVVDTYHHISERPAYFARLRQQLRPGGRLAIVDFRLGSRRGPPAEHKLAPEVVQEELREAGYQLVASHDFLPDQYLLVFSPSAAP